MLKDTRLSPFVGTRYPRSKFYKILRIISALLKISKTIAFIAIFLYIIIGVINVHRPKSFSLDYPQLVQEQNSTFPEINKMFNQMTQDPDSINFYEAKAIKIVDGDTIKVKITKSYDKTQAIPVNTTCKVRYIGVNTPELAHSIKERDEPLARDATDLNRQLVKGQVLILIPDVQLKDKYGRCLFYVFREDGLMVNWALWHLGYAKQMTIPPNVRVVFKGE